MTQFQRRLLFGLLAGCAALLVTGSAANADGDRHHREKPDVELALRVDGRCGPFADHLPPIVIESGVAVGDRIGDVTICVRNRGDGDATLLLHVIELVDVDVGCTGDEALVDVSCGAAGWGELSDSLLQRVGIGSCRQNPAFKSKWNRSLAELADRPLVLTGDLDDDERVCVRLQLRYVGGPDDGVVTQSDRTTWRYSFALVAEREGKHHNRDD